MFFQKNIIACDTFNFNENVFFKLEINNLNSNWFSKKLRKITTLLQPFDFNTVFNINLVTIAYDYRYILCQLITIIIHYYLSTSAMTYFIVKTFKSLTMKIKLDYKRNLWERLITIIIHKFPYICLIMSDAKNVSIGCTIMCYTICVRNIRKVKKKINKYYERMYRYVDCNTYTLKIFILVLCSLNLCTQHFVS